MLQFVKFATIVASLLVSPTYSALSTFTPLSSGGPSYSIGIPSSSTISSTAGGPIYIQITAPSTYSWVAFGIGEQMAGSKVFLVYADGNGNVTVSARLGKGNVMPLNDGTLQAGVQLLSGSSGADGLKANLRVSSAPLYTDKSSTTSPFIAAWLPGSPLNSASLTATIQQHVTHRQFQFDLTQSVLSEDENPFVPSSSNTSPESPQSSSGSGGTSGGTTGGGSVGKVTGEGPSVLQSYQKAHGVIMSVTILLLFPLGAMVMRLGGSMVAHAALQLLSLVMLTVGFGLGIKLGDITKLLYNTAHTIFGTIIFVAFIIQPFLGYAHHLLYKRHHRRTPVSHFHIWYGRLIVVLGMVNGGLGLQLAANTKTGEIVYAVVAAVVAVVYVAITFWKRGKGERKITEAGNEDEREVFPLEDNNGKVMK